MHAFLVFAFSTTTNKCEHASASECICLFAFLRESCMIFTGCYVHEILCVWTSACSCLGHVWFLSAQGPPPCSKALLQGPKITSLSMLPGLWNNNTPGFPITTASANGDGTENMCGQTRARGREGGGKRASRWQRWGLQGLDLEQQLHVNHTSCSVLLLLLHASMLVQLIMSLTKPDFTGLLNQK